MILKTGVNNKGFTFIEVMVSIAILSIGLVAVTQTFASIVKVLALSEDTVRGVFLLEQKIEELEERNRRGEVLQEGAVEGTFEDESFFFWNSFISKNQDEEHISRLEMSVDWKRGRRNGGISVSTFLLSVVKSEEDEQ